MVPEDFKRKGELSQVCAQTGLNYLYFVRIGRLDFFWTVNILHQSVTTWNKGLVWRGIQVLSKKDLLGVYRRTRFVWAAFESVTTKTEIAEHFGNSAFELQCSPGQGACVQSTPRASLRVKCQLRPKREWGAFPLHTQYAFFFTREGKHVFLGLCDVSAKVMCQTVGFGGGGHVES